MTSEAREVCFKTFLVCAGLYLASYFVGRVLAPKIPDKGLRSVTSFAIVQAVAVGLLGLTLLALRAYRRVRNGIYDQIRPVIRERVMSLAFEGESWPSDVPAHGLSRRVMEESIALALTTLKASGLNRVAAFALQEGFVREWVRAFSSRSKRVRKRAVSLLGLVSPVAGRTVLGAAVSDEQAAVRVEAYRALISGDPHEVDNVFRSWLQEPLLIRALLVIDLKRHAPHLLAGTIPALLQEATTLETLRCFEILIAWKRALPSFDIRPWLSTDADPKIRPLALALLPYVAVNDPVSEYLIHALNSVDPEVQCAAAKAAGVLRLEELIAPLAAALTQNRRFALAAANALARMGAAGKRCLEKTIVGSQRGAALVAMEALEHATVRV